MTFLHVVGDATKVSALLAMPPPAGVLNEGVMRNDLMTKGTIAGTPNLLFLGAGASKIYGKLLMGEFVHRFRHPEVKKGYIRAIGSPRSPLLEAICDKQEDLEFLIEELDALSSRDYLERQSFDPTPPGMGVASQQWRWPNFGELATEARKLLIELKRGVYLEYRSIAFPKKTEILAKPIRILQSTAHPTVVFTTNYDPAVEKFCAAQHLRLTDGFVHDEGTQEYIWNREAFDRFAYSDNSVVLFKLHGSTNWHKEGTRIIKGPSTYDVGDPDYQNVMIFPATRKVAIDEPFFTAYDYLEQCLDKAESCLVIGYSFRDYDTLMRFKSAKLSNKRLKIVVLDPSADTICDQNLRAHGIKAYPIPHALGEEQESQYLPLITSGIGGRG